MFDMFLLYATSSDADMCLTLSKLPIGMTISIDSSFGCSSRWVFQRYLPTCSSVVTILMTAALTMSGLVLYSMGTRR